MNIVVCDDNDLFLKHLSGIFFSERDYVIIHYADGAERIATVQIGRTLY